MYNYANFPTVGGANRGSDNVVISSRNHNDACAPDSTSLNEMLWAVPGNGAGELEKWEH